MVYWACHPTQQTKRKSRCGWWKSGTRWALPATSVDMGPLWVIGIRIPTKGVITLLITGRGPPCSFKNETSLSCLRYMEGFIFFYMGLLGCLSELGLFN